MADERRTSDRRLRERRIVAGAIVDVTRLEHENLYGQVEEILRMLKRIEEELHVQRQRIQRLEADFASCSVAPRARDSSSSSCHP